MGTTTKAQKVLGAISPGQNFGIGNFFQTRGLSIWGPFLGYLGTFHFSKGARFSPPFVWGPFIFWAPQFKGFSLGFFWGNLSGCHFPLFWWGKAVVFLRGEFQRGDKFFNIWGSVPPSGAWVSQLFLFRSPLCTLFFGGTAPF